MAYKKTAHRRRRVRSSRRKNAKSRKMMRGGGKFNSLPQCNAAINRDPKLKEALVNQTGSYTNPCPVIMKNGGNYVDPLPITASR